jgi:hypothetical protein
MGDSRAHAIGARIVPDLSPVAPLLATPRHTSFNQGSWMRLESQVYQELESQSLRLSVFAGPIEDPADIIYRAAYPALILDGRGVSEP